MDLRIILLDNYAKWKKGDIAVVEEGVYSTLHKNRRAILVTDYLDNKKFKTKEEELQYKVDQLQEELINEQDKNKVYDRYVDKLGLFKEPYSTIASLQHTIVALQQLKEKDFELFKKLNITIKEQEELIKELKKDKQKKTYSKKIIKNIDNK